jgi:hypothetical protein
VPASCPPLRIREVGGRVRLSLAGLSQADGATLQEAADALQCRLLVLALAYRSHGFPPVPVEGAVGFAWSAFLRELGEIAASGGDVRARVFGSL